MNTTEMLSSIDFKADDRIAYMRAVREEGLELNLRPRKLKRGVPLTLEKDYPLSYCTNCGLVITDDEDDHVAIGDSRPAIFFENAESVIRGKLSAIERLKELVLEVPMNQLAELEEAAKEFLKEHSFEPMQRVSLKNVQRYRYPKKDQYGIFLKYLEDHEMSEFTNLDDYTDCAVIALTEDGDNTVFYMHSRYLKPYEK